MGAALFAWHQYLNKPGAALIRPLTGSRALIWGRPFDEGQIEDFLKDRNIPHRRLPWEELPAEISKIIAAEKVVGWFQGRMEFGPRALGSRSILGDARSSKMQSVMNLKIKYRESFRPFAPSVLAEQVGDYFELEHPSPYMLLVAGVRPEIRRDMSEQEQGLFGIDKLNVARSTIPAVTHVDYSARVQTVDQNTHPLYHRLIKSFSEQTGCGVIVNTSFNVRGEPIVCTPEHAYTCFMRTEMDYLALGPFLLDKKKQPAWQENKDWREEFELD